MTVEELMLVALLDHYRDDTRQDALRLMASLELLLDKADKLVSTGEDQQKQLGRMCNTLLGAIFHVGGFIEMRNEMHK